MQELILLKEQIPKFYNELAKNYTIYAPTKEKGNIIFKKIVNVEDIVLDYLNSKVPPKELLFPKTDILFEYKINGKEIEIEDIKNLDEKRIIFGIRPCDAYSFFLLENFFSQGEVKDEIILKRRENTSLIGIACNTPKTTCFCTSVGGHPFKKENFDIFLVDLDNKYIVEGISNKGKKLIKKFSWLTSATDADIKAAQELAILAEQSISTKLNLEDIDKVLDPNFNHPIWKEISESCIGCGTCSFLCPTCTCFDVIDEKIPNENRGRRVRIWDTCQFCLYSLHTSGHNPRDSTIERCRNRILHKFCYYPENYNLLGCVGCGRCIQLCPVNNDLRKIIEKISNIEKIESEKINA
ncbi:MAG: 4Fe-4S dicluster domain-containing protein [Candidatus Heimdallarchaeota archaeon]